MIFFCFTFEYHRYNAYNLSNRYVFSFYVCTEIKKAKKNNFMIYCIRFFFFLIKICPVCVCVLKIKIHFKYRLLYHQMLNQLKHQHEVISNKVMVDIDRNTLFEVIVEIGHR